VKQPANCPLGFVACARLPETDGRGLPVPHRERQGTVRRCSPTSTRVARIPISGTRSATTRQAVGEEILTLLNRSGL